MKHTKFILLLSLCLFYLKGIGQTHIVQNLNDSGPGSLREAISIANANDTIRFNPALIALGSDTLVLNSGISIDKNLVLKGLMAEDDSLYIMMYYWHPFFTINSTEHVVFDNIILCRLIDDPFSSPYWISMDFSNLTMLNSALLGLNRVGLYSGNSSFKIENCRIEIIDNESVFMTTLTNDSLDYSYEILSTQIKAEGTAPTFVMSLGGLQENNQLIIKDSYFENIKNTISGELSIDISNSTFEDAPIHLGIANWTGVIDDNNKIDLNASTSTFEITEKSNSLSCDAYLSNSNSINDNFSLNLKNCTFNGGIYDSTWNTDPNFPIAFQDYFGPQLDMLSLEGCIFNNITGFNELPIDLSGGYNLFGFPQTIGLHPTDLQNVSSVDIGLGPLQNNGGLTPTHLPSLESLALNGGNPSDVSDAQNGPIIQRRDVGSAEIQALKFTDTVEHCGTEFEWRDSLYTTTDRYFEIQTSVTASLDTVFELDLTLNNLQAQAINDWGFLTANEADAIYQWIDCNTNLPILGETSQVFIPSISGDYQVIIDNGICVDTSDCMLINNIGLEEETEPTIHAFISESTLYFFGNQVLNIPFRIYNTLGQSVFKGSTQDQQVHLTGFTPGVYFIEFIAEKNIEPVKFVIE